MLMVSPHTTLLLVRRLVSGCFHLRDGFSTSFHILIAVKRFNCHFKRNPRSTIHICVDFDIYLRNDNDNWTSYETKPKGIPEFLFTNMNFEDYLSLHFEKGLSDTWYQLCSNNHHFSSPMHDITYTPLFTANILPGYKKGEMPFTLTASHLSLLFRNLNNTDNHFPCGFGLLLYQHLKALGRLNMFV